MHSGQLFNMPQRTFTKKCILEQIQRLKFNKICEYFSFLFFVSISNMKEYSICIQRTELLYYFCVFYVIVC